MFDDVVRYSDKLSTPEIVRKLSWMISKDPQKWLSVKIFAEKSPNFS